MRRLIAIAFAVSLVAGCGESEPTTYAAVRGKAVAVVWDCADAKVANETLSAWLNAPIPDTTPVDPIYGDDDLDAMLPPTGAIPGWERFGRVREIEGEIVEVFLPDVALSDMIRRGVWSEFRQPRLSAEPLLECAVYDLGDPQSAFWFYSKRRVPGGEFRTLGAEASVSDNHIFGWEDRFYFEVSISEYATDTSEAMWRFADWIGRRIDGVTRPPSLIAELPMPNVKPRSHRWRGAHDGFNFDGEQWFTAQLLVENTASPQAVYVVFEDEDKAVREYARFLDHMGARAEVSVWEIGLEGFRAVVAAE